MKLKLVLLFSLFSCSLQAADHFLSFIMPCYNCALTVRESIESIYQQDLQIPFELICTDDGSTDSTLEILHTIKNEYPNLLVYTHEHNKGGGAARNTCVSHCQGDLIFCLDSDNILSPRSVQALINLIDETGCDVATFQEAKAFEVAYVHFKSLFYSVSPSYIYDLNTWIAFPQRNPACGGNYLYTRKSYDRAGGYPEDFCAADTFGFGLRQLATGSIMRTVPGSFYWHRLHDDSYYMRELLKNANNRNHCKALQSFYEIFSPETQKILDEKNVDEIWFLYEQRKFNLASEHIIQSLLKAYNYKYEKRYEEAAQEFSNALSCGCALGKINQYVEHMYNLSKNKEEIQ